MRCIMASIYNHNITTEEMIRLRKMIPGRNILDKDQYEQSTSDDLLYADLFRLYSIRKEMRTAKEYFEKIKDETLKFFLS